MQLWVVVLAWSINVLGLSLVLAVFEIVVEKEKGWASGANPKKLFPGGVVANICEKPYLTAYHLFLFALIVPLILWAELLLLEGVGIAHSVFGNLSVKPVDHFVMQIGEVSFMPVFFSGRGMAVHPCSGRHSVVPAELALPEKHGRSAIGQGVVAYSLAYAGLD